MATIMCLPEEVITIILGFNEISIEDIINFRCTCKQFRWAANSTNFMHNKFEQRWPNGKKYYEKVRKQNEQKKFEEESEEESDIELEEKKIMNESSNFTVRKQNEQKKLEEESEEESDIELEEKKIMNESSDFTEIGTNSVKLLQTIISQTLHEHYFNNSINNLTNFKQVFQLVETTERKIINIAFNFIINTCITDEIKHFLTQSPRRVDCDLTERYCKRKLFHYLRQCVLWGKWKGFQDKPVGKQLMEQAATILAQYLQPEKDIFFSRIKASLDIMKENILKLLRKKYPDHSIFWTSAENFSHWESNNIDDNHWNESEGIQIMDTLDEYIFSELNFRPNESEDKKLEHSCIDNVLEKKYGHEMILLAIYHSVARRLGLRCDLINYYERTCIFWKPTYTTNSLENVRCFNISVNKFSDCLIKQQCLRGPFEDDIITANMLLVNILKIFEDPPWNNNTLAVVPSDIIYFRMFRHFNDGIGRNGAVHFNIGRRSNRRTKNIKFAVGMIVKHDEHDKNRCHESTDGISGVIIGWHRYKYSHKTKFVKKINVTNLYQCTFMHFNNCCDFMKANEQTRYIILTEKNEICYVNEDALTLTTGWVENSEIGRYFCKFEDTHYVPNKMMAKLYPYDAAIIDEENNIKYSKEVAT